MALEREAITRWAEARFRAKVRAVEPIDGDLGDKGLAYASVLRVRLEGAPDVVLHTTRKNAGFGHDDLADRAYAAFLPYATFGTFPRHARAVDVGSIAKNGELRSMGDADDFYFVTEFVEGTPYFHDLERVGRDLTATEDDLARARALADILADAHAEKRRDDATWLRKLRVLQGHDECVAGIVDSYDGRGGDVPAGARLRRIEHRVLDHRHRLKAFPWRLARVHGDFHPWNVLMSGRGDALGVVVLDRSRGAYGEPADDLTAMAINYIFFALRAGAGAAPAFRELFRTFFGHWLSRTRDHEVLSVAQPYFAYRALVVASPAWYPNLPVGVRERLVELAEAVLEMDMLDLDTLERYFVV